MSHPPPASSSVMPRLSVMMFLQFFVWGAWYVSMTGWMNRVGISGLISWAYTVGPIAALVSPFFLGLIADRFFPTQRVLGVMHVLGGAALLAVVPVVGGLDPMTEQNFLHPYVLLLLAHMLCYMPTLGLTNTLAFHHMANPQKQFPWIRVWGTVGWIVGNIVVGGNLKTFGLDIEWIPEGDRSPMQFYIAGGAGVALGLFSFLLPHTPAPARGKRFSAREALGLDSLRLLARPGYLVFIICSFLICIPLAGYYGWARSFVEATGFKNPTLTMSFGQVCEIVFMLLMPLFFARLGIKWMLAVGMLAWVARYALFAAGWGGDAQHSVHAMILLGVLLHGICYDFFFVTGFIFVDRVATKEIRGQAQGFLVLITQGLGLGLGARLFGTLAAEYSPAPGQAGPTHWDMIWTVPAGFALAVLVVFVLLFKDRGGGADGGVSAADPKPPEPLAARAG